MVAAVVIGLIVSVIDVLFLLIIYFLVNNSKISNEEKRRFNKKIFGYPGYLALEFILPQSFGICNSYSVKIR